MSSNAEPSPSWRKDVEVGALSHVGMVRSENQDHWAWWEPEDDEDLMGKGRVLVVCDGMGGHNGGTVASRTTVEAMLESFDKSATCNLKRLLSTAIDRGNASVRSKGQEDPALRNMGTTCVAIALRGRQVQIANIGDSRAYRIHDGQIEQATRDHTYLNDLIEIGLLTPEKAKNHPERNIITRCVGMGDVVQVDFITRPAETGDLFLLCSDGLYNHVEDDEICEYASAHAPEEAAQKLVDLANSRGGEDNITVGIIRVTGNPPEFDVANREHPVDVDDEGDSETPTPIMTIGSDEATPSSPAPLPGNPGNDITALQQQVSIDPPRSSIKGWVILLAAELIILIILQALILGH